MLLQKESINIIRNLARLMIADADEGLDRNVGDEAVFEAEIIECLRNKARKIEAITNQLLE